MSGELLLAVGYGLFLASIGVFTWWAVARFYDQS